MANPIRISQRKDLTVSTEPPVAFLNNHITEVNGKFAELQPIYSPERDKFIEATDKALIPIEETEEMRRQQKLFLESVEKFEKSNKGVDTGIRLQTSAVHTWDDVIKQLKRMEDKYNNLKDVSVLDRTRSCLRQMSHWRKPCERWLQLLPTQSWQGSLLCGGIKIVLAAASKLGLVREEITDSIEQIPFTIDIVHKLSGVYNEKALQAHVSQLFVAILELLQECLIWLTKNPFRKVASAVFKGDDHAAGLTEKRKQLVRLGERIDKYAMAGLHENVRDAKSTLQEVRQEFRQGNSEVLNYLRALFSDQDRLADEARQARNEVLKEQAKTKAMERDMRRVVENQRRRLFQATAYDAARHREDLFQSLKAGPETFIRAQDRAAWILRSGQLGNWLSNPRSEVLVINSHEATHDRQSPVSLFSAMLARSLIRANEGIVLYWSCARNIHGQAEDVVRDLIGQLLEKGHENLPMAGLSLLGGLDSDDVAYFVMLLVALLRSQLEQSVVYIIIDSISFYEDRSRLKETRLLFDNFYNLADEPDSTYALKVLATSPTRCSYFGTPLDQWAPAMLSVPEVVEGYRLSTTELALPAVNEDSDSLFAEITASRAR